VLTNQQIVFTFHTNPHAVQRVLDNKYDRKPDKLKNDKNYITDNFIDFLEDIVRATTSPSFNF